MTASNTELVSLQPAPSGTPTPPPPSPVTTPLPPAPDARRPGRAWGLALAGIGASALALRVATALGRLVTADERLWMLRSDGFSRSVADGEFSGATANIRRLDTMPGVTTMWIGSAAKWVWLSGRRHGLWAEHDGSFLRSPTGLVSAQVAMAVATAALLVLLVVLVGWWVGRGAALVAGVLLATEPFLVAHGAVLHTDELLALFGAGALVATALVLGVPSHRPATGRWWAVLLAGALWAGTFLTKLTALLFLPAAGLLALWALVAGWRATADGRARLRRAGQVGGRCAGTAVVALAVAVLAYPALWTAPGEETRAMWRSVNLGATGHAQFFRGEITDTPGPTFYAVALPLRMTPWFLAALALAVVVLVARRDLRPVGGALACMLLPPAVGVSLASKQFDRYGLPLLALAAVAVGVALAGLWDRLGAGQLARVGNRVGLVAAGALVTFSASVAPWGLAYFNPALGGADAAERTILVGWGEAARLAVDEVLVLEGGHCKGVRLAGVLRSNGTPVTDVDGATYVAVYVNQRQRVPRAQLERLLVDRDLVATVERGGVDYVRIYGRPANELAAAARLEEGERPAGGLLCGRAADITRSGP